MDFISKTFECKSTEPWLPLGIPRPFQRMLHIFRKLGETAALDNSLIPFSLFLIWRKFWWQLGGKKAGKSQKLENIWLFGLKMEEGVY